MSEIKQNSRGYLSEGLGFLNKFDSFVCHENRNSKPMYYKVLEFGTFYYPAWKHYRREDAIVQCDRCGKEDIGSCLGFGQQDICMICVEELTRNNKRSKIITHCNNPNCEVVHYE